MQNPTRKLLGLVAATSLGLLVPMWLGPRVQASAADSFGAGSLDDGALGDATSEADSLAPADVKESFVLVPRGQPWESKRVPVGRARLLERNSTGLVEFGFELFESGTYIQRTLRQKDNSLGTFVYREWRRRSAGAHAGRSLIVEKLPQVGSRGDSLLREWAGGGVRHEDLVTPANGVTLLGLLEQERKRTVSVPSASMLSIFSDQECTWSPALVTRTPLGFGPFGHLRAVDIIPADGTRPSRWIFGGKSLLGFTEGEYEGVAASRIGEVVLASGSHL